MLNHMRSIFNAARILTRPKIPPDLVFFVTSRCNCRCHYCLFQAQVEDTGRKANELALTEIEAIARNYGPLTKLSLSGGEPFVRTDIPEIVDAFYRHCNPSIIDIPTNGFYTKRIAENILVIMGLTSNRAPVVEVQLSIDGPAEIHDSIRCVPGIFARVMETYQALDAIRAKDSRLRIKMNLTYQPDNQDAVLKLTGLLERTCSFDRMQITFPHGNRATAEAIPSMSYQKYLQQNREILSLAKVTRRADLHSLIFRAAKIIKDGVLLEVMKHGNLGAKCGAGRRILVIDDKGLVYPCEPLWQPIGDLRTTNYRIQPILDGTEYTAFASQHLGHGKCSCTWGNAMLNHIVFSPKYYPRLLWHTVRLAMIPPRGVRASCKDFEQQTPSAEENPSD